MNKKGKKKKEKSLRELAKEAGIHPMLPTKFNSYERAKLREFEQELLNYKPNKKVIDEDIER